MEKLEKIEGVYYTQNVDILPIEERIFFTQGLVVNLNDFRIATKQEVQDYKNYIKNLDNEND